MFRKKVLNNSKKDMILFQNLTGGPEIMKGSVFCQYLCGNFRYFDLVFVEISNLILYKNIDLK